MSIPYHIRPFKDIADHEQCEHAQSIIWNDPTYTPSNFTVTIQRHGGVVLGAFTPEGKMLGFVLSFLSPAHVPAAGPKAAYGLSQHSQMAGVLPEAQGLGIGEALKRAQAEATLAMGQNLMTWTYDPLEARNAWLNLNKLGAIARKYIPNCYGDMQDGLNRGLPSDRFEPEWWLTPETRAYFNEANASAKMEIEISPNFQALKRADPAAALALRLRTRDQFTQAFADGYVAVRIAREPHRTAYVLIKV